MSGQRGRRRALLLMCLLAVGLVLPASAGAAAPIRFTETRTILECFVVNDAGSLYVFANANEEFGLDADVAFWPAGTEPENDEPAIGRNFDGALTGGGSPAGFDVEMDLIELATGDPAGTGHITATFEPAGDPEPFSGDDRFGNVHSRAEGVIQALTLVEGSVDLNGTEFVLEDCFTEASTVTVFESSPNTFVNRSSGLHLECFFEGPEMFISLFADADRFGGYTEMFIDPPPTFGAYLELEFTTSAFRATYELIDDEGPTGGIATAEATLEPAGPEVSFEIRRRNAVTRITQQPYVVSGTISIPSMDLELDMADCVAFSEEAKSMAHAAKGPKAGTRLVANDVPEGAPVLSRGRGVISQTAPTSLEPEAEASCLPFDPDFGLQFGRTLWFRVVGTGSEMTVSPKGSNFDTAIAVYAGEPGAFEEVGCNDDIRTETGQFSLQGPVTFDTEAGDTYWIQAGGYAGEYGQLRLSVR